MDESGASLHLEIVPRRLFTTRLPTCEQEFFCYLNLNRPSVSATSIERLTWTLRTETPEETVLTSTHVITEEERNLGRISVAAVLPSHWQGGQFMVQVQSGQYVRSGKWEVSRYHQRRSFRLPFKGQVLVANGHRIGELHRSAWQIPSEQFAWDLLPLDNDGLRLLRCAYSDPLRTEDFTSFGQDVLAPAAGRVVQVVDGHPDLTRIGQFPEAHDYLRDLTRAAGNCVILEHGDGIWCCLAHLRQGSIVVSSGQDVEAIQKVAELGNSGFSSGPHLHLQFMDSPDLLTASPLPLALDVEGRTYAPQAGEIISS